MQDYEEYDYCSECHLYGDDYWLDEDGNDVCICDTCTMNEDNYYYYDAFETE